jgi:hypothetical protein
LGVFVVEPVKAGTLLWVFDPIIDQRISAEELAGLPPAVRELALSRSFVDEDGQTILSRDNGVFLNHSDDPTMSAGLSESVAARDLKAGDELTENYKLLPTGACTAFLENPLLLQLKGSRHKRNGRVDQIAAREASDERWVVAARSGDDRCRKR